MESSIAIEGLSALAHPGRLSAFRHLVRAGPDGMAAGDVARALAAPPNTTSSHLAVLAQAGLIQSRRRGRFIIYAADAERMAALLTYLVADCCQGAPEVCAPLSDVLRTAACGRPEARA